MPLRIGVTKKEKKGYTATYATLLQPVITWYTGGQLIAQLLKVGSESLAQSVTIRY